MSSSTRIVIFSCSLLVAASVFASTSAAAVAPATPARLSALINETSAHFQLSYRMRPNEARERQEQLDAAVAAWRAAPRTAANDEQLAKWLRSAIRTSMPGQREALPPIPDFTAAEKSIQKPAPTIEKRPVEPTPSEPTLAEPTNIEPTTAGSSIDTPTATPTVKEPAATDDNTDPFRDDPLDETQQPVDLFGPWTEKSK
jgi:hypothetical protein